MKTIKNILRIPKVVMYLFVLGSDRRFKSMGLITED
jgi:hypothetical protein